MKRKLDLVKEKSSNTMTFTIDQTKQLEALGELKKEIQKLWETINEQEPYDFDLFTEQLKTLNDKLDFQPILSSLEKLNTPKEENKDNTLDIKGFSKLLDAVKKNKPESITQPLEKLQKAIIQVREQIDKGTEIKNKAPSDYIPVRRVIFSGNKLVYDDQATPSRGGGGGGSSSTFQSGDAVVSSQDTSQLFNGTTSLTPKFAAIDLASSGNNTVVAAVTGKKIRVHQLFLISAGIVNVRFESGADGTALTGQMNLIANTGFVLPFSPVGWFETTADALLNLELSAAVSVDGSLTYTEI